VTVERTQSVVALLAAGGLLALTITSVLRASSPTQLSQGVTMILAWVAVLASALLARQRSLAAPPAEPPRFDGASPSAAPLFQDMRDLSHSPPPPGPPDPREPPPPPIEPASDEPWFDALLEFAQETLGALQSDRLRLLIAQKLPALVGRDEVWVVARPGGQPHVILPTRTEREHPAIMLSEQARTWATFPLKADGQTVGVLGMELSAEAVTARERRMLAAVSGVLARALKASEAFEAMREATLVDPLTGCATRAEGMRRFEAELRRAERSKSSLAVLMLDLDHFKGINDRYGHATGDAVLSAVGEMLLSTLRASDIRCRWGGEEFLVVLPESTIDRARSAAEALRQRIANAAVREGSHTVRVTTSIGITLTRPGEVDMPRLLNRADAALYQAKSHGRNRIRVVLGDFKGHMIAAPPFPGSDPTAASQRTGPERRDPSKPDRRKSYGRRRNDVISGPWMGSGSGS
jgi:diguanylate cyclase (GGDEF)-like protein